MLICKGYDNAIRYTAHERLDHLYEQSCDRLAKSGKRDQPAVITDDCVLSFQELDERANRVARFLLKQHIRSGDRVGLLFDGSFQTYIALLAVLKVHAVYVPLDGKFPKERINFIASDAEVRAILTLSKFEPTLRCSTVPAIFLDRAHDAIASESRNRLSALEKGTPANQLCYIIYTSGSTGNPKGVAVEHPSICNFVKVAAEVYGYTEADRVYQGMTIAFDFSVEELWVPLIAGATLVPGQSNTDLVGRELAEFLLKNKITALCCVPTLLATIEEDLPALRLLLVSGEVCPQNLVGRWHRRGRTILNAYGPTEATVTCTWTELHPKKAVTIGQPLPTYSIVILDPERDEELPNGVSGEICVAGIGLAKGYVNRDDLTEKVFIPDFLHLPNNPSQRIYRTGDLGRITDDAQIEYQGRIDSQVKVRGYRIELTEIESILLQLPQISQAVVSTYRSESGTPDIVAYYTLKDGVPEVSRKKILETLRSRLPPYMIPAYIEKVSIIPMLSCNKVDRKQLPSPKEPRFLSGSNEYVAPRNEMETLVAGALTDILGVDRVSVEDDFFEHLGIHSLLMAQLGATLRQRLSQSAVSMRDIYTHPTVAQLAAHLDTKPKATHTESTAEKCRIPSNLEYYACGSLQLLYYFGFFFFGIWVLLPVVPWILAADSGVVLFLRISGFLAASFFAWTTASIAVKWIFIGKWKREKIPIWSLKYFRFWLVKQLIETNPIALFRGYPIYNLYLRLMGAKIGKNVVIESRATPICTDLLDIGDDTILRKDSMLVSHKAKFNYIHTGPITIGENVVVGEGSVIDIDTVMEDDSQLGHASSLHEKQTIPKGKRYHGSPARVTTSNYRSCERRHVSGLRQVIFSVTQLLGAFAAIALLLCFVYYAVVSFGLPEGKPLSLGWAAEILVISSVLFFGFFSVRFLLVAVVPRLLHLFLKENRVYVLYGFHFALFRIIRSFSNSTVFNLLFGDSSYIVHYLRLVGYHLSKVVQTGTNFGLVQKHDSPYLNNVGSKTIISDGFWFLNALMSNTAFKLAKTAVGADNFIGNNVYYPPDGKTGDDCFVATKALVPIDGKIRESVGLLGSPAFEIPRPDWATRVEAGETSRRRGIKGKNAHNLRTISAFIFFGFTYLYVAVLLIYAAAQTYGSYGVWAWTVVANFLLFFAIAYCIAIERGSLGFRRMTPIVVSVYDKEYWRVERMWKYSETMLRWLWLGTPFRSFLSRLLGIKLGKMVFDDGMYVSEKTLVEIGDYCNLNESAVLQSHALEQSVYKSDYIRVGDSCSIECNAFVHYGCTIGDNVVLGLDSFVMKGETVESNSIWRGNPAVRDILLPYPIHTSPVPARRPATIRVASPWWTAVSTRTHGFAHGSESVSARLTHHTRSRAGRAARRTLRRRAVVAVIALCTLSWTSFEFSDTARLPLLGLGHRDSQLAESAATENLTQPPAVVASADVATTGAPSRDDQTNDTPVEIDNASTLDALLEQARRQWAVKRWTRPSGDNTLETYRLVLNLDPGNPTAQQGIVLLRDAFLRQASRAASRGDFPAARLNYQKVLLVDPNYARAHSELARLADRRPTPTLSSQHVQTTKPSDAVATLHGKMRTFLASAEVDLRSFLKTVRYEGVRTSDVSRPDR